MRYLILIGACLISNGMLLAQEQQGHRFNEIPGTRSGQTFTFEENGENTILLKEKDKPVLCYVYDVITNESVPEKEKTRRTRGCYIHPLYGLHGEELTDDFPKDHYHHHGVFWAWPHVIIDGKHYDLWTDNTELEQRFVAWKAIDTNDETAVIDVENGWFVGEKKLVHEDIRITVFPEQEDCRAFDLSISVTPLDHAMTLRGAKDKSYGGLTIRFKPAPGPDGKTFAQITVPDGVAKEDLPDTRLAWADFTSYFASPDQKSGAAIFIPKTHQDYPPTWLTRHYGPLCIGWPGVEDKTFQAGETFTITYRIWIHKNEADLDRLNKEYQKYAEYCGGEKN